MNPCENETDFPTTEEFQIIFNLIIEILTLYVVNHIRNLLSTDVSAHSVV